MGEQSKALEQIPGVGKKTAQRMVVELKDRLKNFSVAENVALGSNASAATQANENFNDAIAAMTALGYKEGDAIKCVKAVLAQNHDMTTQEIIVAALALITKGRT